MILVLLIGLVLSGSAVALAVRAATLPRLRASERLAAIDAYGFSAEPGPVEAFVRPQPPLEGLADAVGRVVTRRIPGLVPDDLQRMLLRAGLYATGPETFVGYRALSIAGSVTLGLWLAAAGSILGLLAGVLLILVGYVAPLSVLRVRGDRRVEQIEYELPELIDVLIVTVEAGLAFNSSLQLAAQRLRGPLAEELSLALQEQRMGLTTQQALTNMLERCDTPSVRSFVRSILQGESLGVSIGDIMRNLARETRMRRRQAAEERAQKAPIKLLFPLVLLILPALFVVLLYPAVTSILETLGGV